MFRSYLRMAWRNLLKDRQFTVLNLTGLSTGLACALLIYLWVMDERKVDHFHEKDAQLYQVMANYQGENGIQTMEATPGVLAEALAREIPEIEHAVTVLPASWFQSKGVLSFGDTYMKAGGEFIGKDYFNVFSCKFIKGDRQRVLNDKHAIALSDEMALKLFNSLENVTGKTVKWEQGEFSGQYTVAGIFKKNPSNATARFDLLLNYDLCLEKRPHLQYWGNSDPRTYVILRKGTDIEGLNTKIRDFIKTKDRNVRSTLFLAKYSNMYLYGRYENGVQAGGRISYVRLFTVIALFILIIACINFMNLSTAKAGRRIKEIGIQKVMGAHRGMLVMQYLGESMLLTFLALIIALALMLLLLPVFNGITGKHLAFEANAGLIGTVVGITMLTGLLAGSYPALYLSGFSPAVVLRGKLRAAAGELWARKGLVVFQFTLSVMFIAAVLVVYKQIQFIQSKNLGYNRDHIIHFEIPLAESIEKMKPAETFLQAARNVPGVVHASSYYHNLTGDHGGISGLDWEGKASSRDIDFANLEVGYGFIETLGIEMKEGHPFSNDSRAAGQIIFNEAAIKSMGLKNPVGKTVRFWGQEKQIVGVAKDFHFESLYESVKPCFFQAYPVLPNIIVKVKAGTEKQTIARLQQLYGEYNKGLAFDFRFLNEEYEALYTSEKRVELLSQYFAGLAILISCLGLFGLTAFTAQRRNKEIGIRKVLGATAANVVLMLSKEFLKLVLIAVLIAIPLAWWAAAEWLRGFAYHVHIGADIWLIAGASILLITLITVSFQAIKAALANPVKSLRAE